MADHTERNRPEKEPAEGSRKTVADALQNQAEGTTGISNRPRDEERDGQKRVPPRGEQKNR